MDTESTLKTKSQEPQTETKVEVVIEKKLQNRTVSCEEKEVADIINMVRNLSFKKNEELDEKDKKISELENELEKCRKDLDKTKKKMNVLLQAMQET